jgi:hypothetical protein
MDYSIFLFIGMVGFILYVVLFGECGLTKSHRQIMAEQRRKNAKKGIYFRPNWKYHFYGRWIYSTNGKISGIKTNMNKEELNRLLSSHDRMGIRIL